MNDRTLLVAGASGSLGRAACVIARNRGYRVRALGRDQTKLEQLKIADELVVGDVRDSAVLERAVTGADFVFSSLGASVAPDFNAGSNTYRDVDTPINCRLVDAAQSANVRKFVYVSVGAPDALSELEYVRSHELVAAHLKESGLKHAVIRPTGFFSAFAAVFDLAKKGSVPLMGNPGAKTNPIDDQELAELCIDALTDNISERKVGGPEQLSRQEIINLAFEALGRPAKFRPLPNWLVSSMASMIGLFNPRIRDITRFYLAASSVDCLADAHGSRRIAEYFAELATPGK